MPIDLRFGSFARLSQRVACVRLVIFPPKTDESRMLIWSYRARSARICIVHATNNLSWEFFTFKALIGFRLKMDIVRHRLLSSSNGEIVRNGIVASQIGRRLSHADDPEQLPSAVARVAFPLQHGHTLAFDPGLGRDALHVAKDVGVDFGLVDLGGQVGNAVGRGHDERDLLELGHVVRPAEAAQVVDFRAEVGRDVCVHPVRDRLVGDGQESGPREIFEFRRGRESDVRRRGEVSRCGC